METIRMTLCFPLTETHIWLGMKKRRFGRGLWNGFGGRQKPSETIRETAKRESYEEAGIMPLRMKRVAVIRFVFRQTRIVCEVHYYLSTQWRGEPVETEEMLPSMFEIDDIPYGTMWPADKLYLPVVLSGGLWVGTCIYSDPVKRRLIRLGLSEAKRLPY
ncbi:MAG: 8-oxo-dGTP diphosphatase [Parcubacteria group bacterium]